MKKSLLLLVLIIIHLPILVGCGNSHSEIIDLMNERDSLRRENERAAATLNDYGRVMETISAALDSISVHDETIFVSHGELPVTRDEVLENLNRFEDLLLFQQRRIAHLERDLARSNYSH